MESPIKPFPYFKSLTSDEDFDPNVNISSRTRGLKIEPNVNITSQTRGMTELCYKHKI